MTALSLNNVAKNLNDFLAGKVSLFYKTADNYIYQLCASDWGDGPESHFRYVKTVALDTQYERTADTYGEAVAATIRAALDDGREIIAIEKEELEELERKFRLETCF